MIAGLPIAIIFLAEAATAHQAAPQVVYGPAAPVVAKPIVTASVPAERECVTQPGDPKTNDIVVCAVKPQGYRLDPDILQARRLKKKGDAGRPHNPHETYADHSCATVGPMGCRGGPTINLVAAAATAVTMIQKAVTGQNVGKMFETDPHPSEYQLYLEAKAEREEKEKAAAASLAKSKTPKPTAPATQSGLASQSPASQTKSSE